METNGCLNEIRDFMILIVMFTIKADRSWRARCGGLLRGKENSICWQVNGNEFGTKKLTGRFLICHRRLIFGIV